jgi:hypothetical protein
MRYRAASRRTLPRRLHCLNIPNTLYVSLCFMLFLLCLDAAQKVFLSIAHVLNKRLMCQQCRQLLEIVLTLIPYLMGIPLYGDLSYNRQAAQGIQDRTQPASLITVPELVNRCGDNHIDPACVPLRALNLRLSHRLREHLHRILVACLRLKEDVLLEERQECSQNIC